MCAPSPAISGGCWAASAMSRRCAARASGRFVEDDAFTLDEIEAEGGAAEALLSVEAGLTELPCVVVDRDTAARLRRGGSVILRGRDAPHGGVVYAACGGVPVAFGEIVEGALAPSRVFNLPF